jgi:hypothetical protein
VAAAPPSGASRVGAIGFSPELFALCARLLEGTVALEPVLLGPDGRPRLEVYGLVLVAFEAPLEVSMREFSELRRANPLVPFLVLASGVDANFAVELVKCGADDFLSLPPSADALRHKVQRALGESSGPAFDDAAFAAFKPRAVDQNQRHCFRVSVPPDYAVLSTFPGPVERPLDVKDLSIETERAPGGMQVCADRATARRLPFDQWNRRREIEVVVQLPLGSPITARARLVPGLRSAADGLIRFAIEYWVTRPAEKERFRRYWVEAQRRMRRRK